MEHLLAIREIEQLKYRYLRFLDQKEWDLLEGLLTADCSASYGGGAYKLEGREAIMGFLRSAMPKTMLTAHRCTQPEIDLVDDANATGTWALIDVVVETAAKITIRGAAFYEDTYRRTEDGWRISSTGYKRTYEELEPRSDALMLTADWWATGGRSTLGG